MKPTLNQRSILNIKKSLLFVIHQLMSDSQPIYQLINQPMRVWYCTLRYSSLVLQGEVNPHWAPDLVSEQYHRRPVEWRYFNPDTLVEQPLEYRPPETQRISTYSPKLSGSQRWWRIQHDLSTRIYRKIRLFFFASVTFMSVIIELMKPLRTPRYCFISSNDFPWYCAKERW